MRRWMEFGLDGNIFSGTWSLNSNRRKRGPRPQGVGDYPPQFVSMTYKEQMFQVLNAYSTGGKAGATMAVYITREQDHTPLDEVDPVSGLHYICQAQHVPHSFTSTEVNVGPWQFLLNPPIFGPGGGIIGYAPAIFDFYSEPPSENG